MTNDRIATRSYTIVGMTSDSDISECETWVGTVAYPELVSGGFPSHKL